MAIDATFSRYKRNNLLILTVMLIGIGIYSYYDGYKNTKFIEKHTNADGTFDHTLLANRYGWPVLIAGGVFTITMFLVKRNKKVVADEQQLAIGKTLIPYTAIERINKQHFDKKGYFVITYTEGGQSKDIKLSERTYDNLAAILDHTAAKVKSL